MINLNLQHPYHAHIFSFTADLLNSVYPLPPAKAEDSKKGNDP